MRHEKSTPCKTQTCPPSIIAPGIMEVNGLDFDIRVEDLEIRNMRRYENRRPQGSE